MKSWFERWDQCVQYASKDTEHAHQTALFMFQAHALAARSDEPNGWVGSELDGKLYEWRTRQIAALDALFAIPNGGLRDKISAARLKAEGVKAGVPDVMLAYPVGMSAGLFVEMKRPQSDRGRGGVVSAAQTQWRERLTRNQYAVVTCYSFVNAVEAVRTYLINA